jgi:hypothetical protein
VLTRRAGCGTAGGSSQSASEGGYREDYRVKTLEIPELGEIKSDGRGVVEASGFDAVHEPGQAFLKSGLGFRAAVHEDFYG